MEAPDVFRGVIGAVIAVMVSGCSSAGTQAPEPKIVQTHGIKCIASNVEPSRCKTTHGIGVIFDFRHNQGETPSVEDLKVDGAGESEF